MYKGIDGPSTKLTHKKLLKKKCLVKIYRSNKMHKSPKLSSKN